MFQSIEKLEATASDFLEKLSKVKVRMNDCRWKKEEETLQLFKLNDMAKDYENITTKIENFLNTCSDQGIVQEDSELRSSRAETVPAIISRRVDEDETTDDENDQRNLSNMTEDDDTDDYTEGIEDFQQADLDDDEFDEATLEKIDEMAAKALEEEGLNDSINQPQDKKYLDILKKYFGHSRFRPMQWRIIDAVLNQKRDNCVVMSTGYGKSICFQFPSVFSGGITLVVSPLISLMEDQVMNLKAVNIRSCLLCSTQDNKEIIRDILRGQYRVVYLTPEYAVAAKDLLEKIKNSLQIDLIAIDEAHCISQWGHEFRASYRKLGSLRNIFSNVPVMALTATATPEVKVDICRSLKLKNPVHTCTGFDRPNLYLKCLKKSSSMEDDLKMELSSPLSSSPSTSSSFFNEPTIIYCPTKKLAELVESAVKGLGLLCGLYHAGLPVGARKRNHNDFANDKIKIIVATVAFGMGINKPDVRRVIHYGAPSDLERYYQEIGRAGRDGLQSKCTTFFSASDFNRNRGHILKIGNEQLQQHKLNMHQKLAQYLETENCRRRSILEHFEGKKLSDVDPKQDCCDNCTKCLRNSNKKMSNSSCRDNGIRDYSEEAIDLLGCVQALDGRYGLVTCISFLRGSQEERIRTISKRVSDRSLYGKRKDRSKEWWRALGQLLLSKGYLIEKVMPKSFGAIVNLTQKASTWLDRFKYDTSDRLLLPMNKDLSEFEETDRRQRERSAALSRPVPSISNDTWLRNPIKPSSSNSEAPKVVLDPKEEELKGMLYKELLAARDNVVEKTNLSSFTIFSNKVLVDIATLRPTTLEHLISMEDVAEEKARRYGQLLIDCVKEFCLKHDWKTTFGGCALSLESTANQDQKVVRSYSQPESKTSDSGFLAELASQSDVPSQSDDQWLTTQKKRTLPVWMQTTETSNTSAAKKLKKCKF